MGAGNDLHPSQLKDGTPLKFVGFDADGKPAVRGAFEAGATGNIPKRDASGNLIPSNLQMSGNAGLVLKDGGVDTPYGFGVDALGGYQRRSVNGYATRYIHDFNWLTSNTPSAAGSSTMVFWGSLENWIAKLQLDIVAIKSDGSEGLSQTLVATFRKDGAAAIVQVGTTTTVHLHRDDEVEDPIASVAVDSGFVKLNYTSGGASIDGYIWTVWANVVLTVI